MGTEIAYCLRIDGNAVLAVLAAACWAHSAAVWAPIAAGLLGSLTAAAIASRRRARSDQTIRAAALAGAAVIVIAVPFALWMILESEPGCRLTVS